MQSRSKKQPIRNLIIRHLREWHRKLGIIAAFFLIFLSITGIALNHTDALSLSHKTVKSSVLFEHYGINNPATVRYFGPLSVTDNYVWLGEKLMLETTSPVIAIGKFQAFYLVTTRDVMSVFNQNSELIDQLDQTLGLPKHIQAMALTEHFIVLKTPEGLFQSDEQLLTWQPIPVNKEITWLAPKQASPTEIENAQLQYKAQFLNIERIVLDAHSGRIFGDGGVLFMDIIAVFLILLSLSGVYIWLRYAKAKR